VTWHTADTDPPELIVVVVFIYSTHRTPPVFLEPQ
jgi:hypothetical protein